MGIFVFEGLVFVFKFLEVDSFSILFNHRSGQKSAVSPGFWVVS